MHQCMLISCTLYLVWIFLFIRSVFFYRKPWLFQRQLIKYASKLFNKVVFRRAEKIWKAWKVFKNLETFESWILNVLPINMNNFPQTSSACYRHSLCDFYINIIQHASARRSTIRKAGHESTSWNSIMMFMNVVLNNLIILINSTNCLRSKYS